MKFEKEPIPDPARLYLRVHRVNINTDGTPRPGAFSPMGSGDNPGLSVDWEKYSTAEATKQRAKSPADNAVIQFVAREVRALPVGLKVEHLPSQHNQAHSAIADVKKLMPESRVQLGRIYSWAIDPPPPPRPKAV